MKRTIIVLAIVLASVLAFTAGHLSADSDDYYRITWMTDTPGVITTSMRVPLAHWKLIRENEEVAMEVGMTYLDTAFLLDSTMTYWYEHTRDN